MSPTAPAWRLLIDPPRDAAWNMAVDEAILERYSREDAAPGPTLRIYGWSPPALSLGRTQAAAGAHDPEILDREGIELVRRPTGGGAVLHEHERTYAVIGRLRAEPFPGGVIDTYGRIAEALIEGLARLGVPARRAAPFDRGLRGDTAICFEHRAPHELTVNERKLAGSAQARRLGAFLQHGSIPWSLDAGRLGEVIGARADAARFTDLGTVLGVVPSSETIDDAIVAGFEERFGAVLAPGHLSEEEGLRAAELRCWKYDSMAWTLTGRLGERERRWGPV